MSAAPPKSYVIRVIADLLKVPKNKRAQCVHDLLDGLEAQERMAAQERESAAFGSVTWIDDGRDESHHELPSGRTTAFGGLSLDRGA